MDENMKKKFYTFTEQSERRRKQTNVLAVTALIVSAVTLVLTIVEQLVF